jgi:hypothetical protein
MNGTKTVIGMAMLCALVAITTSGWSTVAMAGPRACEPVKACTPVIVTPPPPACTPAVVTPPPKACEPAKYRISQVLPNGAVLRALHARLHSAEYVSKHGPVETQDIAPQPAPAGPVTPPPPAPAPAAPKATAAPEGT